MEWASNLDRSPLSVDRTSIVITGLEKSTTYEDVFNRFSTYGNVVSAQLLNRDKDEDKSKSESDEGENETDFATISAIVKYGSEEAASRAIQEEVISLFKMLISLISFYLKCFKYFISFSFFSFDLFFSFPIYIISF